MIGKRDGLNTRHQLSLSASVSSRLRCGPLISNTEHRKLLPMLSYHAQTVHHFQNALLGMI